MGGFTPGVAAGRVTWKSFRYTADGPASEAQSITSLGASAAMKAVSDRNIASIIDMRNGFIS